jgi:hypothetical protein
MKRSIYAKTSKPHLRDQKTILSGVGLQRSIFENVKHPLSPGRLQLAELLVFSKTNILKA